MLYQPLLKDDMIRKLYRYAKATNQPMTKAIDSILRSFFDKVEIVESSEVVKKPAFCVVYSLKKHSSQAK